MADNNHSRKWPIIVAAVIVTAIGVLVWPRIDIGDPEVDPIDPPKPDVDIQVVTKQVALKNRGLGFLENSKFCEANEAFLILSEQLPGEPIGLRNLAISKLLKAVEIEGGNHTPQQLAEAIEIATPAIRDLAKQEIDSPIPHLLAAKLAKLTGNEKWLEEELSKAAEIEPDEAAIRYQLFLGLQFSTDEEKRQQAIAALGEAYRCSPQNVAILLEWLKAQAKVNDPQIVATLENAKQLLRPLAAGIKQNTRADIIELIDEAITAAADNKWPVVARNVGFLVNVVKPEVVKHIDHHRVTPHPLEYVIGEFSREFYQRANLPTPSQPEAIDVQFVAAPEKQQLQISTPVRAIELADFDLDRHLDIIVLTDDGISVWGRKGDAENWQMISKIDLPAGMHGVVLADLDRDYMETPQATKESAGDFVKCIDADVDLVAFGRAGLVVLRNKLNPETGERILEPVAQTEDTEKLHDVVAAALADVDHDGDLDLVVSSSAGLSLWSNREDLTFADISNRSALPPAGFVATTIVPVDWNRDVSIDLILADASGKKAGYLENLIHGRFRWQEFEPNFNVADETAALVVLEADGNASWDLATVGTQGVGATLTLNPDLGVIRPLRAVKIDNTGFGHVLDWDYDNDGYLDLLAWGPNGIALYRGAAGGRFMKTSGILSDTPREIGDCNVGDLDGDGDWDLIIASADGLTWYRNEGGNANHWVDITISADKNLKPANPAERVNMHCIGSLLELKAGLRYQAQVAVRQVTHFGLGQTEQADVVRILWTNGIPENRLAPASNRPICAYQDLKGSCPYLYTWNGERFTFMTDCLWSAPIGLQFAEGVLAPAREWEYLKIPGDRLAAKNGEYRLQITEELWEAAYFDSVKLIAVDHPAGVAIYSNEKVGPAEIAAFKIHTVRNPRPPITARDKQGRDVLPQIIQQDGQYLKPFTHRLKQGLTDEHFIELDLGQLDAPQQIMLYLTGWVFPSDTSLNVAISQNPNVRAPRPPSIQVPDAKGGWIEAIAYTGFPGGKTKTIAVDISKIFPADDYRLRIVTSMELYWDAMFFTVDEKPATVNSAELSLISADLHYRGFSRRVPHPGNGPESYDYLHVATAPKWPPMAGRFTRYGDVSEIIGHLDDRLVVMGSGDEMTLRFRVPPQPLPDGWQRDFILYNVGWDKDADLNTVYGQTVEPLPFRAMNRYPYAPTQSAPQTPQYLEYLQKYQTRTQNAARFWKQLLRE